MANLSQLKRQRMLAFLDKIKETNDDEDTIIAINEIENELNSKKYGLVWEQHEEAVDVMMQTHIPVFTEDKSREIHANPDSENYNFLLEGDNLHSLKLLEKTHRGRIDVIYIDPPYNTGNQDDFIYDDAIIDKNDSFIHSKWLSFISERLIIARNLLKRDGVLVISIGYQEVHNLMLLCKELFDSKQVVCVTVKTSGGKPNGGFNYTQEYLIFVTSIEFEPRAIEEFQNSYSSPYHGMNLATFNQVTRPNQAYPVFVDDNGKIVGCGKTLQDKINDGTFVGDKKDYVFDYSEAPEGTSAVFPVTQKGDPCVWRLIPSRLMSDWKKGYIKVVPKTFGNNQNKFAIQYLSDGVIKKIENKELETYQQDPNIPTLEVLEYKTAGVTIPTIWDDKQFYTTNGSNEIKTILGEKVFKYPKPLDLIIEILRRVSSEDALILDFFAGSGTTGNAVMKLNNMYNSSRRFILCTNNESNICENVTYRRMKNVIDGYILDKEYKDILFEKTITLKDFDAIDNINEKVDSIINQYKDSYQQIKKSFQDGILSVIGINKKKTRVNGIPTNIKYYRTDFIEKERDDDFYSVEENLLEHIKELIQLERGISLDNSKYLLVLTEEDAENIEKNPESLKNCEAIYISGEVMLSKKQEMLFQDKELITIPQYYFESELIEVGEI